MNGEFVVCGAGEVGFGTGLEGVDEGLGEADGGFAVGETLGRVTGGKVGRGNGKAKYLVKTCWVSEGVGLEVEVPIFQGGGWMG